MHDGRARETPDHEAGQVRLQIMSGIFFMHARQSEFREPDDEASYANLSANVEKLGEYTLDQVRKSKSSA